MSLFRSYGRYDEIYNAHKMEYPGYDSGWVLGVQTSATPYVHHPSYLSGGYYGREYDSYGNSYTSKYRPRSSYGSSHSSNIIAYPHTHHSQPSILTQLFPNRRRSYSTSRSSYLDEVKLKVEICCQPCKIKMLESLRNMSGVYDVRVEGTVHTMVTVTGNDLKPKKILKKVRKIIKAADYWSDWHYSDGVNVHHSGYAAPPIYSPSPVLRHIKY